MQTSTCFRLWLVLSSVFILRGEGPKAENWEQHFLAAAGTQRRIDLVLTVEPGCVMLGKAIAAAG